MWISKDEYNKIVSKANLLDHMKIAIEYHENFFLENIVILSTKEYDRICSAFELKEEIKDLKEERDSWINLCRQKDTDAEFWKSAYIDMRKQYFQKIEDMKYE